MGQWGMHYALVAVAPLLLLLGHARALTTSSGPLGPPLFFFFFLPLKNIVSKARAPYSFFRFLELSWIFLDFIYFSFMSLHFLQVKQLIALMFSNHIAWYCIYNSAFNSGIRYFPKFKFTEQRTEQVKYSWTTLSWKWPEVTEYSNMVYMW